MSQSSAGMAGSLSMSPMIRNWPSHDPTSLGGSSRNGRYFGTRGAGRKTPHALTASASPSLKNGWHSFARADSGLGGSPALDEPATRIVSVGYIGSAYTQGVDTRTSRWSLRLTPVQHAIVRQVLNTPGCH